MPASDITTTTFESVNMSKMKTVDLIYFLFLFNFQFSFDFLLIFLFLELRVRIRRMISHCHTAGDMMTQSQVTRHMKEGKKFWKNNVIQYVQHTLIL